MRTQALIAALVALLAAAPRPAGAALDIARDGVSPYEILVELGAQPITLRAAQDLQLYLKKATGAALPIRRTEALGDRPAILVGDSQAARGLGVTLDGVAAEGFRIKTVGRHLVIAGRDTAGSADSMHWRNAPQAGTWHGVSAFLEGSLGIRWFLPGDAGEVVPQHPTLTIPDQDLTDAPKMVYRRMSYLYANDAPPVRVKEVNDWLRRNRSGWSIIWSASHIWLEHFKAETYFKEHPDWFALVNGRRVAHQPLGAQICTTNAQALDEFARVIIEFGRANPGVMFSLSPNDGGGFCECANCRALDRAKNPDGSPVLTDRIMTYANEVARRVTKVLPQQTFGIYAYSYFADPPLATRLHPSIYVMNVANDAAQLYAVEEYRKRHLEKQLLPWKAQVENLFFYSHAHGFGNMDLPGMHPMVVRDVYRNLARAQVKGFSINVPDSFAAYGLTHYLYLKMAWNPAADFEAVYADALEKCYGKAAAPLVRDYFAIVERRVKAYAGEAMSKQDVAMGTVRGMPALLQKVYPGLSDEGEPLLRKARALAEDSARRARLHMPLQNLPYPRPPPHLAPVAQQTPAGAKPDAEGVKRARGLCVQRADEVKRNEHTNLHTAAAYVADVEQTFSLPFKTDVYDRMLMEAVGGKSKATARRAAAAPKIDGDLGDAAWQGAEELPVEFRKDDASRSALSTRARVAYDDRFLYLAVTCAEPLVKEIKDTVTQRDGEVWNENEIEVFLDPQNDGKSFYQLLANSLGTLTDIKHAGAAASVDWDSRAQVGVAKGADSWSVEMAIPLESLGAADLTPGDVWALNVCRVRTTVKPSEYTCWSPTFGGFGQPDRFGYLVFR